MASATIAPALPARPARSTTRARAKRRKVTRPPQPRVPADFFDPEAHQLLIQLFHERAERWQQDSQPPLYFYRRDSEPRWGAEALRPCSGTTIRIARHHTICDCLCMDLELGLRLLTLTWTAQNRTAEGDHEAEEWRLALSGCLWRIGQLYREFKRRKGAEGARRVLQLAMDSLWGVPEEHLRRA